jgi:hypothetical protein
MRFIPQFVAYELPLKRMSMFTFPILPLAAS